MAATPKVGTLTRSNAALGCPFLTQASLNVSADQIELLSRQMSEFPQADEPTKATVAKQLHLQ